MALSNYHYLSYILDEKTPTYGNKGRFLCEKISSIDLGDGANESLVHTTVHIGTHLDMPLHFFNEGPSIEIYDANFFSFEHILFIEFTPKNLIIRDDLIAHLEKVKQKEMYEILIVKTGICHWRESQLFWQNNYGFHPFVAEYLRLKFPRVRVFGFDSISISSSADRLLGREAHAAFLNPQKPILLLEDMDLIQCSMGMSFISLIIAPLRIAKCDGLPCTVVAKIR